MERREFIRQRKSATRNSSFILWFPLLLIPYVSAVFRRHEVWGRLNCAVVVFVSTLLTAALSILLIPSPGSHPDNDGYRKFEAIQRELKMLENLKQIECEHDVCGTTP
jgi:hypothetical protein